MTYLHVNSAVTLLRRSQHSLSDYAAGSVIHFHSIPGKAHGMVGSPAEMRHLMAFWAQALKHRPVTSGEAATVVEVQGGASA